MLILCTSAVCTDIAIGRSIYALVARPPRRRSALEPGLLEHLEEEMSPCSELPRPTCVHWGPVSTGPGALWQQVSRKGQKLNRTPLTMVDLLSLWNHMESITALSSTHRIPVLETDSPDRRRPSLPIMSRSSMRAAIANSLKDCPAEALPSSWNVESTVYVPGRTAKSCRLLYPVSSPTSARQLITAVAQHSSTLSSLTMAQCGMTSRRASFVSNLASLVIQIMSRKGQMRPYYRRMIKRIVCRKNASQTGTATPTAHDSRSAAPQWQRTLRRRSMLPQSDARAQRARPTNAAVHDGAGRHRRLFWREPMPRHHCPPPGSRAIVRQRRARVVCGPDARCHAGPEQRVRGTAHHPRGAACRGPRRCSGRGVAATVRRLVGRVALS